MFFVRKLRKQIESRKKEAAKKPEAAEAEEKRLRLEKRLSEIAGKTQIAQTLKETEDLFINITDSTVPSRLDGRSGDACHCNYLRLKDGVSVVEAVDKYIAVSDNIKLLETEISGNLRRYNLFRRHTRCLGEDLPEKQLDSWFWEETFFYAEESNLQASETELESLFERCRMNRIHIIHHGFSLTENKSFYIRSESYPGSADDAATYTEYNLMWEDPPEG